MLGKSMGFRGDLEVLTSPSVQNGYKIQAGSKQWSSEMAFVSSS
jgi:hypothetical protein